MSCYIPKPQGCKTKGTSFGHSMAALGMLKGQDAYKREVLSRYSNSPLNKKLSKLLLKTMSAENIWRPIF